MYNNGYTDENSEVYREYDFYDGIVINDARSSFNRFFTGLFVFNLISYAIAFGFTVAVLLIFGEARANEILTNPYVSMIMGVLPMYLVALPVLMLIVRKIPTRKPQKQDFTVISFLAAIPVTMLFMTVGNIIGVQLNGLIGALKGAPVTNDTAELVENSPIWLTVLLVVIIAPVVEEFIFRKLMIDKLSTYGNVTAILVSSLAFGLFHGNLYQFFYSALVGLVLGYIAVKSGSWLNSVILHALINLYGAIVSPFIGKALEKYLELYEAYTAGEIAETAELVRYSVIAQAFSSFQIAMLAGGVLILIFASKKKKLVISEHYSTLIPKGKRGYVIFGNFGMIAFLISAAIIFTLSIL